MGSLALVYPLEPAMLTLGMLVFDTGLSEAIAKRNGPVSVSVPILVSVMSTVASLLRGLRDGVAVCSCTKPRETVCQVRSAAAVAWVAVVSGVALLVAGAWLWSAVALLLLTVLLGAARLVTDGVDVVEFWDELSCSGIKPLSPTPLPSGERCLTATPAPSRGRGLTPTCPDEVDGLLPVSPKEGDELLLPSPACGESEARGAKPVGGEGWGLLDSVIEFRVGEWEMLV